MTYSLKVDGDYFEKTYYNTIILKDFPSYEIFWVKYITLLTNRPKNIQLKTDSELQLIGKSHHELCLAQLHYTVLRQLIRTFQVTATNPFTTDHLIFSISTLIGAQDCAFELLERFSKPTKYDPWINKKQKGQNINGGKEAQTEWKRKNKYPLQKIRDYRNHLVHGRTMPGIIINGEEYIPKVGKEMIYSDWRVVTNANNLPLSDFDKPKVIINYTYGETIKYFEEAWKKYLLPNI
ncbi:MAG TPA: hypothetical protein PKM65_20120 [Spirochaetota bacterium]|nr:hypothetical protein [Spirochaetota bacterium]HNT13120.1 hypothetical protein [Spirochaetota bacterium]